MTRGFSTSPFAGEPITAKKIAVNYRRNREQDHTAKLDEAGRAFDWQADKDRWWNEEQQSLLYGTPLWDEADDTQRLRLNQLFWVAYTSQIISAEVATIYFNQTSAAGLYGMEDFRQVCDMLDLESSQERAHIAAFKAVGDQTEAALFGRRVFTWEMRGPYAETMIFPDSNRLRARWKSLQLKAFGLLSSGSAFIASQYFTVRGLRTLNGKMVQHKLARAFEGQQSAPVPTRISHYHFQDESYHFNSSTLIGHEVVRALPAPTRFERWIADRGVAGCQRDHSQFSVVCNGLFWHEPATFQAVYEVLRSPIFDFDDKGARDMMRRCFCEDSDGVQASFTTLQTAQASYQQYVADLDHLSAGNRAMSRMGRASVPAYLRANERALRRFVATPR